MIIGDHSYRSEQIFSSWDWKILQMPLEELFVFKVIKYWIYVNDGIEMWLKSNNGWFTNWATDTRRFAFISFRVLNSGILGFWWIAMAYQISEIAGNAKKSLCQLEKTFATFYR